MSMWLLAFSMFFFLSLAFAKRYAELLEAHAIIAMRYDATEFGQGATEVLAYGTAVRLERT